LSGEVSVTTGSTGKVHVKCFVNEPNLKPEKQINHRFIYIQKNGFHFRNQNLTSTSKEKKEKILSQDPHPNPKKCHFLSPPLCSHGTTSLEKRLAPAGKSRFGFVGQISEISVGRVETHRNG